MKKWDPKRATHVAAVAALAVGLLTWHASIRRPAGPDEGVALQSAPSGRPESEQEPAHDPGRLDTTELSAPPDRAFLRLAVFNTHGGKGEDDRVDLARTARAIAGFDVVGLNEVRGNSLATPDNQAARLGRLTSTRWLHAPAEYRWYFQSFGNALLTAAPVTFWQRIPLPRRLDRSYRNLVMVEIQIEGEPVRLLVTHVTQRVPEERKSQLRMVFGLFLALAKPAVLMGDLNSLATDKQVAELVDRPEVIEPISAVGAKDLPTRVDWIFLRGLQCRAAGVEATAASDHPIVWCEVGLPLPEDEAGDR